ncbi:MAG: NUDIX domain-containing protein [Anaerolineaceae bacterium]|nr:NUDIX domain-containing protein [Anaerolineaceae bacterium]
MVDIIKSERAGKNGNLAVGCSAAILTENREHILLIKRGDNGKWAVPGGYMEPGENFSEACAREVYEETGLRVEVKRLICVYTDPNILFQYPDGNGWQLVILHFEARVIDGELLPSDESPELNYFTLEEVKGLEIGMLDRFRIADSFPDQGITIIRNEFG